MKTSVQGQMVIKIPEALPTRAASLRPMAFWAIQTCHICNPCQSVLLRPGPLLPLVTVYIHTCKRQTHTKKSNNLSDQKWIVFHTALITLTW